MSKIFNFKKTSLVIALIFLFTLVLPFNILKVSAASESTDKNIQIVYINDFHGSVDASGKNPGMVKLAGRLKAIKAENTTSNTNTVFLAGGDLFQGSAASNLTYGAIVNEFLKEVGLTASAVGNHEFDWGTDKIAEWASKGGYKFLASNIYDKTTGLPVSWADPYQIVTIDGVKIGLIGLTTPETAFKTLPENVKDIEFKDPNACGTYWAKLLKSTKQADIVIAVTHLGAAQDSNGVITGEAADLANVKDSGIDAILCAHTHMAVCGTVNNIPVVQAYYNGRNIGKLNITVKPDNTFTIAPASEKLYDSNGFLKTLPDDSVTQNIYTNYMNTLAPILDKPVGKTVTDLTHDKSAGVSILGEWSCEVMAKTAKTQIGITNGGGLRTSIKAGNITMGNLYEVMPFDNTLYKMDLKGSDLKRVIENGIMNTTVGWVQLYGVKVYYDADKAAGNRITAMYLLDGTKIDMNKYYSVVTNDFMFTGGDNYDFTGAKNAVNTNLPIRDALAEALEPTLTTPLNYKYQNLLLDEPAPAAPANTVEQLPKTGSPIDSTVMILIGIAALSSGFCVINKKKKVS
ncbi:MAG: 5'-nucleotidase C-terminal domain-containing protein [Bacillota bacterium]|nr:5'-nucleotidase C-terminal domain-containing protein [Bacillota bacterium]